MVDTRNTWNITGGLDVVGADNEKVGNVAAAQGDYIVVSKGFFFPTDYYIPTSAINTVNDDGVYLNVTKDEALNQGWDTIPATYASDRADTGYDATTLGDESLGDKLKDAFGGDDNDTAYAGETRTGDSETIRVPLSEEELTAQKRAVERGAVHVDKVVTEEQQTLEVPVTEERVNVSRRVVDRDVAPGETTFEEGTIEVPVYGEEVEVEKRARVREEIEISKDVTTNTERVSDTVRREDVRVTDDTDKVVDNLPDERTR